MDGKGHDIKLENREVLSISGVKDIYNFDEKEVALETSLGMLIITGEGLRINKLNIDDGYLDVRGNITSCVYSESREFKDKGKGIFARMFK